MKHLILTLLILFIIVPQITAQGIYPVYKEKESKMELLSWKTEKYENTPNLVSYEVKFTNFSPSEIINIINSMHFKYDDESVYYASSNLTETKSKNDSVKVRQGLLVFKYNKDSPDNIMIIKDEEIPLSSISKNTKHNENQNYEFDDVNAHYKYNNKKLRDEAIKQYVEPTKILMTDDNAQNLLIYSEVNALHLYHTGEKESAYFILDSALNNYNKYNKLTTPYIKELKEFYKDICKDVFNDKFLSAKRYYYDEKNDKLDSALLLFGELKDVYLKKIGLLDVADSSVLRDTILYGYANSWYLTHDTVFTKEEIDKLQMELKSILKDTGNKSSYYFKTLNLLGNLYFYLKDYTTAKKYYAKVIVNDDIDRESTDYKIADKNLNDLYLKNPAK
jgi:tetratricopeptide (TPR) repeat protein